MIDCPFSYRQDDDKRINFFPTLERCVGYATVTADRTRPVIVEKSISYTLHESVVYDWNDRGRLEPRVKNKASRREFLPKSQRR